MAQPRFGELLWRAVQQVKVNQGRSITAVKLELGELCHVGVPAVEKWKRRNIPCLISVVEVAEWPKCEAQVGGRLLSTALKCKIEPSKATHQLGGI